MSDDTLKIVGQSAAAALVEMVAALECDYDRLEELRAERDEAQEESEAALIAWLASDGFNQTRGDELKELVEAAGECESREEAETRIQEDALSVLVRTGWYEPATIGDHQPAEEFEILLSTGGPASRIRGELDGGEPSRAWLEVQDWGTPWTLYVPKNNYKEGSDIGGMIDASWTDTLLAYARCFYYGEG